jgi:hypothetical protein
VSIYAVNGKEPVAAWIPSLDTAGNGTTTLTALASSLTGTLRNMDAATDWVADVDAGGVRALDFDGINDYVDTPGALLGAAGTISVSCWIKPPAATPLNVRRCIFSTRVADATGSFSFEWGAGSGGSGRLVLTTPAVFNAETANGVVTTGEWQHVAFVRDGGFQAFYRNGVSIPIVSGFVVPFLDNTSAKQIGRSNAGGLFHIGLLDDLRVFNQRLLLADIEYLYAGGFGRGIIKSGGIIPILRQHYAAMGAR